MVSLMEALLSCSKGGGNSPKPDDWKNVFLSHVNYLEQASNSGLVINKSDIITEPTHFARQSNLPIHFLKSIYRPFVKWKVFSVLVYYRLQSTSYYQGSYLPVIIFCGDNCPTLIMLVEVILIAKDLLPCRIYWMIYKYNI